MIEGDRPRQMKLDRAPWGRARSRSNPPSTRCGSRSRCDGLHLRRLLHAGGRAGRCAAAPRRRPVGDLLDTVLRVRDLRQRRMAARAGVHLHVPLRAFPERDVRPRHPRHLLRRRARRAARVAPARHGPPRGRPRGLHRLHPVRAGVSDRHRHPRRPPAPVHRLCRVHRRLRPGDGAHGLSEGARALHHPECGRWPAGPHRAPARAHLRRGPRRAARGLRRLAGAARPGRAGRPPRPQRPVPRDARRARPQRLHPQDREHARRAVALAHRRVRDRGAESRGRGRRPRGGARRGRLPPGAPRRPRDALRAASTPVRFTIEAVGAEDIRDAEEARFLGPVGGQAERRD